MRELEFDQSDFQPVLKAIQRIILNTETEAEPAKAVSQEILDMLLKEFEPLKESSNDSEKKEIIGSMV